MAIFRSTILLFVFTFSMAISKSHANDSTVWRINLLMPALEMEYFFNAHQSIKSEIGLYFLAGLREFDSENKEHRYSLLRGYANLQFRQYYNGLFRKSKKGNKVFTIQEYIALNTTYRTIPWHETSIDPINASLTSGLLTGLQCQLWKRMHFNVDIGMAYRLEKENNHWTPAGSISLGLSL
ncbi:MAG: hypothetical protein AAFP19_10045 [Bacteroidota bacterium]